MHKAPILQKIVKHIQSGDDTNQIKSIKLYLLQQGHEPSSLQDLSEQDLIKFTKEIRKRISIQRAEEAEQDLNQDRWQALDKIETSNDHYITKMAKNLILRNGWPIDQVDTMPEKELFEQADEVLLLMQKLSLELAKMQAEHSEEDNHQEEYNNEDNHQEEHSEEANH